MAVKKPDLADTLDTVAALASDLRAAGVLRVTVGEVSFVLAPPPPPGADKPAATEPEVTFGDLDDAFDRDERRKRKEDVS
jgi:hypothetical protein